jgi:hypothetical protein
MAFLGHQPKPRHDLGYADQQYWWPTRLASKPTPGEPFSLDRRRAPTGMPVAPSRIGQACCCYADPILWRGLHQPIGHELPGGGEADQMLGGLEDEACLAQRGLGLARALRQDVNISRTSRAVRPPLEF